jgi:hypothetical protein
VGKLSKIKLPGGLVATVYPAMHPQLKPIHEFDLGPYHYCLNKYCNFALKVTFEGKTILLLLNRNIDSVPLIHRILNEEGVYSLMFYVYFIVVMGEWKLIHQATRWATIVTGALAEGVTPNVYALVYGNGEPDM